MGSNVRVCKCVCTHMCYSVCKLAACVHVSGDPGTCWWRNQGRESSPWSQAALLPQESFTPVCHIGWWSLLNAQNVIRNMLLSVSVCLQMRQTVIQCNVRMFSFLLLDCSFYLSFSCGVVLCVVWAFLKAACGPKDCNH